MTLDNTTYYTPEANAEYMSCSQFKSFLHCEAAAMAELSGENTREDTTALLTGSYVDSYYEGTLDEFRKGTAKKRGGPKNVQQNHSYGAALRRPRA